MPRLTPWISVFLCSAFCALFPALQLRAAAQNAPSSQTRVIVVVDSSAAMQPMTPQFRAGLKMLLDGLPPEIEVGLISTGGQLRVRVPPTIDREKVGKAMAGFSSDSGGNAIITALMESDKRFLLAAKTERPVLVLLTTDSDALSDPAVERYNEWLPGFIQRRGKAYGVVIRSRNMGLPSQIVENVSKNSGGHSETIATAMGVADQMKLIGARIAAAAGQD